MVAKMEAGATTYYHQDHLSNRLVTNSTGGVAGNLGTYPFGESWYNSTSDKLLFTTYERDSESNNDYALARSYASRLGRFTSLDPLSGSTADPQSLNRYSYVKNDPINFADPSGAMTLPGLGLAIISGGVDFGDDWGEFDSLDQLVGYGELYYNFNQNPNFDWQGQQEEGMLQSDAASGEIQDLGSVPIYASILITGDGSAGGNTYSDLKAAIRKIFQRKPDCADLFGGMDKVDQLLNSMNIESVPSPAVLTGSGDTSAYNQMVDANANLSDPNQPSAVTAFGFSSPTGPGWNGGQFDTFVGTKFANSGPEAQEAVLMHEMAHPLTGYSGAYGMDANGVGVLDQPNSEYSPQSLLENCVKDQ